YLSTQSIIQSKVEIEGMHYLDPVHQTVYLTIVYHIKHRIPLKPAYHQYCLQQLKLYPDSIHQFLVQHFGNDLGTDLFHNLKNNIAQENKSCVQSYLLSSWRLLGLNTLVHVGKYFLD